VKTSPGIIDVDPISARPAEGEDLMKDQPLIYQAPRGPGTSGEQVPESSSSSLRLPRREINWNGTPWLDDIFEDNEDMKALRTSIVTINHALTVRLLFLTYFSCFYFAGALLTSFLVPWLSLAERAKSRVDLLKNAMEREQQITDLEQELKQVREAAAAEKKKLKDELAEEKRKAT
jgi:hypothetical protein